MKRNVLTDQEMRALLSADLSAALKKPDERRDFWFTLRTAFVFCYIIGALCALVFFPDAVLGKFDLPTELYVFVKTHYLPARIFVVGVATLAYLWCWFRGFYFSYVALAAALIAAANVANDYSTIYVFVKPEAERLVMALLGLRLFVVALLAANFFAARDDRR
jgi:hypothetical protein